MTTLIPRFRVDGRDGAPPLVLSNSLGTDLHLWDPQIPALTERYLVVRYDQRGHGGSPGPPGPYTIDELAGDVVALLDHLGIGRASFCGLSLGGMVGMALAVQAPERVDRLVLVCTSARLPREPWAERAATVRSSGLTAIAEAVVARWFTPPFVRAHPDVRDHMRAVFLAADPEGYAACCDAIASMDLLDRIGAIAAPTLVIAGADDTAIAADHGEAIARRIRGARLTVVPDAAHLANVEQPESVTAAILDHLARADPLEAGMRIRREVLGDAHVDAAARRATPFTADFQTFITRYAWGEIWGRPGLDRRTRSCVTVAMLVALGRDEELALHLRAARTNGVTVGEIKEILLQAAVYCGVPAANHAFSVAQRVLAEPDGEPEGENQS